jgi:hypothetical protein
MSGDPDQSFFSQHLASQGRGKTIGTKMNAIGIEG